MQTANGPARSPGGGQLGAGLASVRDDTFITLLVVVAVMLWLSILPYLRTPDHLWPGWGTLVALLLVEALCLLVHRSGHSQLASWLFVSGLFGGAASFSMAADSSRLAPSLFVPVVLIAGTLLGTAGAVLSAALASGVVVLVSVAGEAHMSTAVPSGTVAMLWLVAAASWTTTRHLMTTLHWAWTNSRQADHHLAEARDYQGKLAAVLRQLEDANYRLGSANYALAWAHAEAEEARRAKVEFAAHVSHELRTPLNLVVGFADLMCNNPEVYGVTPLPAAYLADLTAVHRNAQHLQSLVNDILDLSQLDAGHMPVIRDITDIGAIVHEAAAIARPLLERKGLRIACEIEADMPLLSVDRLRIREVLLNLLNNAARFTDRGGVQLRVVQEGNHILIQVTDSGVGLKSEDIERLFEAYRQLDTATVRGRNGSGLGLAIAKRFIELHGGRIWATSAGPGRGSTFTISLPIEPDEAVPAEEASTVPGHSGGLPRRRPTPRVVVVDDDLAIADLLRRHLQGYEVLAAASESEVEHLASDAPIHAVVTDLPPGGQIHEWQERWSAPHNRGHGWRVIGCPMPSGRRIARSLGLADYLVKPVTRDALLAAVTAVGPATRVILVVDDQPAMVALICRMLRSAPQRYQLLRAYSGGEALDLLRDHRPDLVILDLLMPQVDGFTVLERMKADPTMAQVPVIMVSAQGAMEVISPSPERTVVLINDRAFSVGGLVHLLQTVLDRLPPEGAATLSRNGALPAAPPWSRAF